MKPTSLIRYKTFKGVILRAVDEFHWLISYLDPEKGELTEVVRKSLCLPR